MFNSEKVFSFFHLNLSVLQIRTYFLREFTLNWRFSHLTQKDEIIITKDGARIKLDVLMYRKRCVQLRRWRPSWRRRRRFVTRPWRLCGRSASLVWRTPVWNTTPEPAAADLDWWDVRSDTKGDTTLCIFHPFPFIIRLLSPEILSHERHFKFDLKWYLLLWSAAGGGSE